MKESRKLFNFKKCASEFDFIIGFASKELKSSINEQDKKHMRIMAIIQLAKSGSIETIINSAFTEKFYYDEQNQTAYYCIKIIRKSNKRKEEKYVDC